MSWTDGVDRATGDLVTAAQWNALLGAVGSLQGLKLHAHGGTTGEGSQSLGPLVQGDFTDAAAPAAPGAGKTRLYSLNGAFRYRPGASGPDMPIGDSFQTISALTGTPTTDMSLGSNVEATVTGNVTGWTLTNLARGWYSFRLTQNASGPWTIVWPTSFKWPSGVAPTTSGINKTDIVSGYYDGTSMWASAVTNY